MTTWTSTTFCDTHGDARCDCERFTLDVLMNDAGTKIATIYFSEESERYYGTVLPVEPFVLGSGWKRPPMRTGAMASFPACKARVEKMLEDNR